MTCESRPPVWRISTVGFSVKGAFNKLKKTREMFWSGRRDLNSGPPAPKAGGLPKTTVLFSTFLLKQNNLAVMVACGWLCTNVPICLLGGHKNWHSLGDGEDSTRHGFGPRLAQPSGTNAS